MSIPDFDSLILSDDQQRAYDRLVEYCIADSNPFDPPGQRAITLKGHAGTGKSLLTTKLVHDLGKKISFALTAPTNKATKVLDRMAWESNAPVADVRTIYSLLGLKLMADGEVKQIRGGAGKSSAQDFNIIAIDEGSMISQLLYNHIMKYVPDYVKLLFIGDVLQLPPVGEDISPVFTDDSIEVLEMSQVVRQAKDNPIIALAQDLREAILTGNRSNLKIKTNAMEDGSGIYVLPQTKFTSWMRQGFKSDAYSRDGDSFRTVAWRNDTVNAYNQHIRRAIYGESLQDPFMRGERVLTAAPVLDLDHSIGFEQPTDILMKTDEEGFVLSVDEMIHPHIPEQYGQFKVWRVEIGGTEQGSVDTYLIHPDDEKKFKRALNDLSSRAKKESRIWKSFWALHERINDIRPAHALTSHRSQGSTYDVCFVDVKDIFANRNVVESLKSLYVACTRASKTLCLTGL